MAAAARARGAAAALFAAVLAACLPAAPVRAQQPAAPAGTDGRPAAVARGEYLLHAAGCVTCHTAEAEDAVPLAGGRALETPFGTFRTPNITPDPETGIGGWREPDFLRALRHGVGPGGSPYYPAFPYRFYAGMTEADARDLFAYLDSLEPVRNAVPGHELDFPFGLRWALWPWRWLFFEPTPFVADPGRAAAWNRGRYLVEHLGHCGACHTPRNLAGATVEERHLAGNPEGPEGKAVPNITPDPQAGIGEWSKGDLTFFLETGFLPDGDVAGGAMAAVVEDSTSRLTAADREAIADYLFSLPPLPGP